MSMEMDIAKLATEQKAAETSAAVGVALLKQAQNTSGEEALALLQAIPQAPSIGGMGETVDISV
jgi:hypothetical protein